MSKEEQDQNTPTLSFEMGAAVCNELLPLAERFEEYAAMLEEGGFEAFKPILQWTESFCSCERDAHMHRLIQIETAKSLIYGKALRLPSSAGVMKEHFISPLIREREDERDKQNGMSIEELSKHFSLSEAWIRRQIDPCVRNLEAARCHDREKIEADEANVHDRARQRFEIEAAQNVTELGQSSQISLSSRIGIFIAAAEQNLSPSGFNFERKKSRPSHPAVFKPVCPGWELRWVISDVTTFDDDCPHPIRLGWPKFDPWLILCPARLGSNLGSSGPLNFLRINYTSFIPGFSQAYRLFFRNSELELLIKVHSRLIEYILGDIESAIKKVMSKL